MQHKLPNSCLSPSICPLCLQNKEDCQHLLIFCKYLAKCQEKLFNEFNLSWVFDADFREHVRILLRGLSLNKEAKLLWENVVKAILAKNLKGTKESSMINKRVVLIVLK